jgi:glycosyltransferase involved in cell wall biosynthesis
MTIKGNKNVALLSTSYWHAPLKFRRHQWASIASRNGYNVTYVNPTFTLLSFIQDSDAREIFWDFFKKPLRVNEFLTVVTMPPLLPFQRKFLWIDKLNRRITGWLLRKKLRVPLSTLIVYEPTDLYRISSFPESLLVYECVDEHSEYPVHSKIKQEMIEMEKQLIAKAHLLSVSSSFLLQKKKSLNESNIFIPNGVNFDLFHSATSPETKIREDISAIPGPIVLYVGAIMEWFDYELLLKLADRRNCSIVLIGPQTVNLNLFKPVDNIYPLGVKKQSDLPHYLKKADVCIIPFLVNDLVKGVNPLKLYEYMAAGKPVVSTALPDVIPFNQQNHVHIGYSHDEFIQHVHYLIENRNNMEYQKSRADIARQYSWENLFRKLFDKLRQFVVKRC